MEEAVKKIVLNHYNVFKTPITIPELVSLVKGSVGVKTYSQKEFDENLRKLIEGRAVTIDALGRIIPLYSDVEILNEKE